MPETTQNSVQIDRFVLEVPGRTADYGREVAMLVAAGLAACGALPQAGDVPTLRITLPADPRDGAATLAQRIVAETLRCLARET